jgi:hypothetical protein
LQLLEGAIIRAFGGIDATVQAGEGLAHRAVFGAVEVHVPEARFELAQAAEFPIGADDGIDEEDFQRGSGLELLAVVAGEGFEFGRVLAGEDLGLGVDAGFQMVETGDGLPRDGGRTGALLCVATIRIDLSWCSHKVFPR